MKKIHFLKKIYIYMYVKILVFFIYEKYNNFKIN